MGNPLAFIESIMLALLTTAVRKVMSFGTRQLCWVTKSDTG